MHDRPRPRILAVDDELHFLNLLTTHFARSPHELLTVPDSRQALECVQDFDPQLVLVDLMLPGGSGWDLIEALRALPQGPGLRILVVTAGRFLSDPRMRRLREQADGLLYKPCLRNEILSAVEALLAGNPGPWNEPMDPEVFRVRAAFG